MRVLCGDYGAIYYYSTIFSCLNPADPWICIRRPTISCPDFYIPGSLWQGLQLVRVFANRVILLSRIHTRITFPHCPLGGVAIQTGVILMQVQHQVRKKMQNL